MNDAERLNFSFVLPGRLAGMAWPFPRHGELDTGRFLHNQGVQVLVNLSGEPYSKQERSQLAGLSLVDLPIADYCPPEPSQADGLWQLWRELASPHALALHCAAGMGRTGTLLACLLGRELNLDGPQAVARVRSLRPGSVETVAQEEMVERWLAGSAR